MEIIRLRNLPILIAGFLAMFLLSCSKNQEIPVPVLEIDEAELEQNFPPSASVIFVAINTNLETVSAGSTAPWCDVTVIPGITKLLRISVGENGGTGIREAKINLLAGGITATITVIQLGTSPVIILKNKSVQFDFRNQSFDLAVTTNVNLEVMPAVPWITAEPVTKSGMVELNYTFRLQQLNQANEVRTGHIIFRQQGGDLSDSVQVKQSLLAGEKYGPGETKAFGKDRKIRISGAVLTPGNWYQHNENIEKSFDWDMNSLYHSPWPGIPANSPVTLEYFMEEGDAETANYLILYPRTTGYNGRIKTATIWISTAENPEYVQVGTINAPNTAQPQMINFLTPVLNLRKVKVIVTDAYSHDEGKYYVSLAEIEIYESRSTHDIMADAGWFTDQTFSELRPGTSLTDIAGIQNPFIQNIATWLLSGKYPSEYRIQEYEPYREAGDLARELKTSAYSQFENPTGMYFSPDEEVVVFVGQTHGENISLRIRDFGPSGNDYSYPLREGLNILTMKGKGNGYLNYFTSNYRYAEKIKVHIASGKENGTFDITRHNNSDGSSILDNAVSEIMDIKGERSHLAFSVQALRANCYTRMKDLISLYDSIVSSQHTMMGLKKYHRLPANRMFARTVWSGYMYADGTGAGFNESTMQTLANPDKLIDNNWGPAHEFGHINQTRPGMMWVGTTEVTNNIFSVWIQYCLTPDNLRLEHENTGGSPGGRFNAFLHNALINRQEWGLQAGPDSWYGANGHGVWEGDHFVKLVPLWQLHLFFHLAGLNNEWHRPYFWADIFEKVRNTEEKNLTHGELQMNFVKNTCDAVSYDLSGFFTRIGMLTPVDKIFGDYTNARKTITQNMIDEVIRYTSQYPKPPTDYIHYISGNSLSAYQQKLPVTGSYNSGVSGTVNKQVSGTIWRNVAVFETYRGNEIIHITMVGSGSAGRSATMVPYPGGSTRIEAVGWDGTRALVFGNR